LSAASGGGPQTLQNLSPAVTAATQGVFSFVAGVFGGLVSFLLVLVMTFYLVVDEGAVKRTVTVAPKAQQAYLAGLLSRLQKKVGVWLRAQLILMGIIGILTYLVLTVIGAFTGLQYALVLALIAGLLEFIPYLGPLIAAVPGVFLAYAVSPTTAAIVAIAYYGIQLLENNVIVPKVMQRALGLSPIVSIVVFLVGAKLAGIAGAFLAIPIATAAMVVAQDLLGERPPAGRTGGLDGRTS
jgi:predicted PurR-regulated permease PerM